MRLISFSLFGDADKYNLGAVENAKLAPLIYPGWICRFYCDPHVTVADRLRELGCEVVKVPLVPGGKAMSWRFIPAEDKRFDRVIFRDSDSRLNIREAAAVAEWMASGLPAHAMHDHDHHRAYPIFGGMWGCIGGLLPKMPLWINRWPRWHARMDDMHLLTKHVQPLLADKFLRHSSVEIPWPCRPFPEHAPYAGFVGEQVD